MTKGRHTFNSQGQRIRGEYHTKSLVGTKLLNRRLDYDRMVADKGWKAPDGTYTRPGSNK